MEVAVYARLGRDSLVFEGSGVYAAGGYTQHRCVDGVYAGACGAMRGGCRKRLDLMHGPNTSKVSVSCGWVGGCAT